MQQPKSRWFATYDAAVPRTTESRPVLFPILFKLRKVLFLSAMLLLPSITLQADDSKIRLLGSGSGIKELTPEMVREIFFMRLSSWPDGSPIHVFVLPDNNPLHIRFAKEILGVYPFQLRSAWDRLVFSGTGVSPTLVESADEMRARVESTPGSIGYTDKK